MPAAMTQRGLKHQSLLELIASCPPLPPWKQSSEKKVQRTARPPHAVAAAGAGSKELEVRSAVKADESFTKIAIPKVELLGKSTNLWSSSTNPVLPTGSNLCTVSSTEQETARAPTRELEGTAHGSVCVSSGTSVVVRAVTSVLAS